MRTFDKIIIFAAAVMAAVLIGLNIFMYGSESRDRPYIVDIERASSELKHTGEASADKYEYIEGIYEYDGSEDFFRKSGDFAVRDINGKFYRIDYRKNTDSNYDTVILNAAFVFLSLIIIFVLLYIRKNIIKPFSEITGLPEELSKGNLTVPVKENKNRYFGKFLWGLDMLREELEKRRRQELEFAKKEKTLLLSLSHDIKTPLAAIKLSSKALSRGLYKEKEKQLETAENINVKADEIEKYVNEIIKNSTENFMKFDVSEGEFYLSEALEKISGYYREKMRVSGTEFEMEKYGDILVNGDRDRLEEVIQNIIENAVKYGDGRYIKISFSDEEDCRLITVRNSGCELSANDLPHIFDSFYRGANASGKQGSGLGLYICRSLMNAMGGEVFADTEDGDMAVTVVCRKA